MAKFTPSLLIFFIVSQNSAEDVQSLFSCVQKSKSIFQVTPQWAVGLFSSCKYFFRIGHYFGVNLVTFSQTVRDEERVNYYGKHMMAPQIETDCPLDLFLIYLALQYRMLICRILSENRRYKFQQLSN